MNASEIRNLVEKELMELEGVVGVSHRNPKIVIYVESEEYAEAVPTVLAGVPVETKVVGKVRILERVRPLVGGVSISPPEKIAGTLGVITYDGKILTNFHVVGIDYKEGKVLEKGTPVVQPAVLDGGDPDRDVVGTLLDYVEIGEVNNLVDAAVVEPTVEYRVGEILGVGKVDGWTDPVEGMKVVKRGRSSGVTESYITDVNATLKIIGYPNLRRAIFEDVFIVEPAFAEPGDSGSLVVCDGKAVGLLFAGSRHISVGCKMKHIVDILGVNMGPYYVPVVERPAPNYAAAAALSLFAVLALLGVEAWPFSQPE